MTPHNAVLIATAKSPASLSDHFFAIRSSAEMSANKLSSKTGVEGPSYGILAWALTPWSAIRSAVADPVLGQPLGRIVIALKLPVHLSSRDPQAAQAVGADQPLPIEELLHRQAIALAGIVHANQAVADRGDDLGLAPDDPAHGVSGGGRLSTVSGCPAGPITPLDLPGRSDIFDSPITISNNYIEFPSKIIRDDIQKNKSWV